MTEIARISSGAFLIRFFHGNSTHRTTVSQSLSQVSLRIDILRLEGRKDRQLSRPYCTASLFRRVSECNGDKHLAVRVEAI